MVGPPTKRRPADLASDGPLEKHIKPPKFTPADGHEQARLVLDAVSKLRELITRRMCRVYAEQEALGPLADHCELAEAIAMAEALVELQHSLTPSKRRAAA